MKKDFFTGFLVALVLVLSFSLIFNNNAGVEHAFAGGATDGIIALTGQINQNQKEMLYIIDTSRKTATVYEYDGRAFNLKAARHIAYDLQLTNLPPAIQNPSIEDVRKILERQ